MRKITSCAKAERTTRFSSVGRAEIAPEQRRRGLILRIYFGARHDGYKRLGRGRVGHLVLRTARWPSRHRHGKPGAPGGTARHRWSSSSRGISLS
jgi:hypothetical protein